MKGHLRTLLLLETNNDNNQQKKKSHEQCSKRGTDFLNRTKFLEQFSSSPSYFLKNVYVGEKV